MTETSSPEVRRPSRLPLLLGLGAVVVLCGAAVLAIGAGAWFLTRNRASAQEPAIEYILDASPRMAQEAEGGSRLSVAQGVLAEIVRPADPTVTAGLRVFGTGAAPDACKDTNLVVPLAPANQTEISTQVMSLRAGAAADAAVAEAMIAAIGDLSAAAGPHTLVVVTGGADSCNPEAGQLIAQEAERAGISLQTFVVGYLVPEDESQAIRGMVEETGGGTYLEADSGEALRIILKAIQTYVDDPTTTFPTITLGTPQPVAVGPGTPQPGSTGQPTAGPDATTSGPGPDNTQVVQPGTTPVGGWPMQTACDHPYFPLRTGASWTYAFDEGTYTWSVASVTGDLDNAEAVLHLGFEDLSIDYHFTCTREGLVSYDFGSFNAGESGGTFSFEVTDSSGVWLPAADQLVPGATWAQSYTTQSTVEGGGQSFSVSSTVSNNHTVAGIESSTSEAGTFDTLRVDTAGTFSTQSPIGPAVNLDTSSTAWFAYGVGMIRSQSTSAGTGSTTTLVSYTMP
jgi:hypothetical protein